jgi:hypothetical protein
VYASRGAANKRFFLENANFADGNPAIGAAYESR